MIVRENVSVEAYVKRRGGRTFRTVRFYVNGANIEVGEYLVDSDEKAIQKAKEAMKKAIDL